MSAEHIHPAYGGSWTRGYQIPTELVPGEALRGDAARAVGKPGAIITYLDDHVCIFDPDCRVDGTMRFIWSDSRHEWLTLASSRPLPQVYDDEDDGDE